VDLCVAWKRAATDYTPKPVRLRELVARVRAHLRDAPAQGAPSRSIRYGELRIDLEPGEVVAASKPVELTFKEFELLAALARHPNRVFTRDQLFSEVWGSDFLGERRTGALTMRALRAKVE